MIVISRLDALLKLRDLWPHNDFSNHCNEELQNILIEDGQIGPYDEVRND